MTLQEIILDYLSIPSVFKWVFKWGKGKLKRESIVRKAQLAVVGLEAGVRGHEPKNTKSL